MTERDRSRGWLELANAAVLSIAALASSWSSYQAGLWDGEQASHYSRANALRIQASRAALEGDAKTTVEMNLFGAWLDAKARDEETLARFYQARFPDDLKPAFNAWIAEAPLTNPSAAPTPFAMEIYRLPGHAAAAEFDRQANATFDAGQRDNATSDAFEQTATILALAMFFGGIGQVFKASAARMGLLTVAAAIMVVGLLRLMSLPIQALGF